MFHRLIRCGHVISWGQKRRKTLIIMNNPHKKIWANTWRCCIFKCMAQTYSACRDGAINEAIFNTNQAALRHWKHQILVYHIRAWSKWMNILVSSYFVCNLFGSFCFVVKVKSVFSLDARSLYSPVVIMKWKMVLGWALVLRRGNTSPLLTFAPNTQTESFCSVMDRVNGPSPNSKYTIINKKVRCFHMYSRQI